MLKGKLYTIGLHCIGWLMFFSLPLIFTINQSIDGNTPFFAGNYLNLLAFGIYIAIFYLHTYFLFPLLYFRKRPFFYFLCVGGLFLVVFYLRPYDRIVSQNSERGIDASNASISPPPRGEYLPPSREGQPPPFRADQLPPYPGGNVKPDSNMPLRQFGPRRQFNGIGPSHIDIISITLFILVIVLSIALILEKRWKMAVEETSRAEADKANAELSFLKAQINPHFLFNTLNNIYSLAVSKNENVADAIMKLSNIMRYVTDDVNEDFVSLEKELDAIGDYISLQRLRIGKKALIDFTTEGDINGKMIAPLILMPFIENAFKHGLSNSTPSTIMIKVTSSGNNLILFTENRLFVTPRNTERTGIGISNTRKRLEQVYPGKYLLDINSKDDLFTIHLVIYI